MFDEEFDSWHTEYDIADGGLDPWFGEDTGTLGEDEGGIATGGASDDEPFEMLTLAAASGTGRRGWALVPAAPGRLLVRIRPR